MSGGERGFAGLTPSFSSPHERKFRSRGDENALSQGQLPRSRVGALRGPAAGDVVGSAVQRVLRAGGDRSAAGTGHVEVWHQCELGDGTLLVAQHGVLSHEADEPVAELG